MKTRYKIAWLIVALAFALMPLLFAQTNLEFMTGRSNGVASSGEFVLPAPVGRDVATNAPTTNAPAVVLPPGVDQIAALLPAKAKALLGRVVVWVGSLSLILAPFSVRLGSWLRDRLNKVADNQGGDTDKWLAKLFANPIYKFLSTLLLFVNISLPTTAELERAIRLQAEAVQAAKRVEPAQPKV